MTGLYIGAFIGKSWTSKIIQRATRSKYSHVAFILADGRSIEAWGTDGVVAREDYAQGHRAGTVVELYHIAASDAQKKRMLDFARNQVGSKYDWRAILSFATRSNQHTDGRWICSELIQAASVYAKRPLQERVDAWRVAPCWIVSSPRLSYAGQLVTGQTSGSVEAACWMRSPCMF
jgi:hypothetical protein